MAEKNTFLLPDQIFLQRSANPHFSPTIYCNDKYAHVYCVMLNRYSRRIVKYVCESLNRMPCTHRHLCHFATIPGEKCGLNVTILITPTLFPLALILLTTNLAVPAIKPKVTNTASASSHLYPSTILYVLLKDSEN